MQSSIVKEPDQVVFDMRKDDERMLSLEKKPAYTLNLKNDNYSHRPEIIQFFKSTETFHPSLYYLEKHGQILFMTAGQNSKTADFVFYTD